MMWCEKVDLMVWLIFSLFLPIFEFRLLVRLLAKLVHLFMQQFEALLRAFRRRQLKDLKSS